MRVGLQDAFDALLANELSERQQKVIELRFGLVGEGPASLLFRRLTRRSGRGGQRMSNRSSGCP